MSEEMLDGLQQVLDAVHTTIWAYGEIGAKVSEDYLQSVVAADNRHRALRGQTEDMIRSLGGDPVASAPAYSLPTLLTDDASALALAAQLEVSMAQRWRYCIGAPDPTDVVFRQLCLDGLSSSARAALMWRREFDSAALPPAFPGMP